MPPDRTLLVTDLGRLPYADALALQRDAARARLDGRLAFVSNEDGLSARGRFALSGAQAQALFASEGKVPVTGKFALSAEVEGAGRSPAAFIGSLSGQGAISLEDAQLNGLNPQVFNAMMRAVDLGVPTENSRVREFVTGSLDMGSLSVPQAEAAFVISGGQVRISNIFHAGDGNLHPIILFNSHVPEEFERARNAGEEILRGHLVVKHCGTGRRVIQSFDDRLKVRRNLTIPVGQGIQTPARPDCASVPRVAQIDWLIFDSYFEEASQQR